MQLSLAGTTYDFSYGPDRRRYRKQRLSTVTHYVGTRFEHAFGGGSETFRTAVTAHGRTVLIRTDTGGGLGTTHRYVTSLVLRRWSEREGTSSSEATPLPR